MDGIKDAKADFRIGVENVQGWLQAFRFPDPFLCGIFIQAHCHQQSILHFMSTSESLLGSPFPAIGSETEFQRPRCSSYQFWPMEFPAAFRVQRKRYNPNSRTALERNKDHVLGSGTTG